MGELQLFLLGNAEVWRGGEPLTGFNSSKVRALLFYLVVTGRSHHRPALAGLLWGDMAETTALTNLRKALTNLRKLVGPHLDISRRHVAFKPTSPYWLDVEQFEAAAGDSPDAPDFAVLQAAVELYQGDFLEGFYVRNAPEFEDWVLAQRTRLRELAVQALYRLTVHYIEQGEGGLTTALDYATRLLALEPWREEAHRQMMLLLALDGQRSAALAQYETCRRALAEELGVEPGEETIALYERILSGDLSQAKADISPLSSAPRHNLPAQVTPLVGREMELSQLTRLLASPGQRLITILGPGGNWQDAPGPGSGYRATWSF